jgi:hypothetical protein
MKLRSLLLFLILCSQLRAQTPTQAVTINNSGNVINASPYAPINFPSGNLKLNGSVVASAINNLSFFAPTTSAQLMGVISDETGTGSAVFGTSPTLITPALGTPSAVTLTNATGLPIFTGVSGLGTGVAAALGIASNTKGAVLVNGVATFYPSAYGAVGNGGSIADAAITTGTAILTSATANFTSIYVGAPITVIGAGTSGGNLTTTIASLINSTTVLLAANATTTVSSAKANYGVDDTTALQSAITAAIAVNGNVVLDGKTYRITSALGVSGGCSINGAYCNIVNVSSNSATLQNLQQNVPQTNPYIQGAVLLQTTAATDILDITATNASVNLYHLGFRFSEDTKWSNTGYGVLARGPIYTIPTIGNFYPVGIQDSNWKDLKCYGNDGNHYAFYKVNSMYTSMEDITNWGGGLYCFESNAAQDFNNTYPAPYTGSGPITGNENDSNMFGFWMVGGSCIGGIAVLSTSSFANYINMYNAGVEALTASQYGSSTPLTNSQYMIYIGSNTLHTVIYSGGVETTSTAALPFYLGGSTWGSMFFPLSQSGTTSNTSPIPLPARSADGFTPFIISEPLCFINRPEIDFKFVADQTTTFSGYYDGIDYSSNNIRLGMEWNNKFLIGNLANNHSTFTTTGTFDIDSGSYAGGSFTGAAVGLTQIANPAQCTLGRNVGGSVTYTYEVIAKTADGQTTTGTVSAPYTTGPLLTGSAFMIITWTPVAGASSYDIYRVSTNAGTSPSNTTGKIATVTGISGFSNTVTFNDTGFTGDGTTAPSINTTGCVQFKTAGEGIIGGTTSTYPQAGIVGNKVTVAVTSASPVSLTTATPTNICDSGSLAAGHYLVSFQANVVSTSATMILASPMLAGINTTSATLPTTDSQGSFPLALTIASATNSIPVADQIITLTTSGHIYGVENVTFTAGTEVGFGKLTVMQLP